MAEKLKPGQLVQLQWSVATTRPPGSSFLTGELAFIKANGSGYLIELGERQAQVKRSEIAPVTMQAPNKVRLPLDVARVFADELLDLLAPACARIEIAGSIRREQPDVGDVEIVCIPHLTYPDDLFGFGETHAPARSAGVGVPHNALDALCIDLLEADRLAYRLNRKKTRTWGSMNKLGWFFSASGGVVAVDIFSSTPENWGIDYLIRTGPKEFSTAMVMERSAGGALPAGWRVKDHRLTNDSGHALNTPEECDVFAALGLPCIPPPERSVARLRKEVRSAVRRAA